MSATRILISCPICMASQLVPSRGRRRYYTCGQGHRFLWMASEETSNGLTGADVTVIVCMLLAILVTVFADHLPILNRLV